MVGTREYNKMDFSEKVRIVDNESLTVLSIFNDGLLNTLYTYNGFFIEVKQDMLTSEIMEINNFIRGKILDKYLIKINIESLFV